MNLDTTQYAGGKEIVFVSQYEILWFLRIAILFLLIEVTETWIELLRLRLRVNILTTVLSMFL